MRSLELEDGVNPAGKEAIKLLFKEYPSRAITASAQDPHPRLSTRSAEEVGRQPPYLETADTGNLTLLFGDAPLPALWDDVMRQAGEQPVPVQRLAERVLPNAQIGKRLHRLAPHGAEVVVRFLTAIPLGTSTLSLSPCREHFPC